MCDGGFVASGLLVGLLRRSCWPLEADTVRVADGFETPTATAVVYPGGGRLRALALRRAALGRILNMHGPVLPGSDPANNSACG